MMTRIDEQDRIICDDCLGILGQFPPGVVDLVFADPPYFLSPKTRSAQGRYKSILKDKGEWDRPITPDEMHEFNRRWIDDCIRVLRPGGSIWICGTFHNAYSCGFALQQFSVRILNDVCWVKDNPPPNLGCRSLTHAHETLIWAAKLGAPHTFGYSAARRRDGCGRQLKDVWRFCRPGVDEYAHGKHPTQKPEALVERVLLASSRPGDLVVDPFAGSGTTAVVARRTGRRFVVIEKDPKWVDVAKRRVAATVIQTDLFEDRAGSDPRAARGSG